MKKTIHSLYLILSLAPALFLTACADTSMPGDDDSETSGGAIRFSVSIADIAPQSRAGFAPQSRADINSWTNVSFDYPLIYNGPETTFNFEYSLSDKTMKVGCIVASVNPDGSYEYLANSIWDCISDGSLRPSTICPKDGTRVNFSDPSNDILPLEQDDAVKLKPGIDYAFFFYYLPKEMIQNNLENPSGELYENASWTKFPIYTEPGFHIHHTDIGGVITLPYQLCISEFMYASVTSIDGKPINTHNLPYTPIPVTLKKQMATVDILLPDTPIIVDTGYIARYIYAQIKPQPDSNGNYSMPRMRDFDFSTGKFVSDYVSAYTPGGVSDIDRLAVYDDDFEIQPIAHTIESTPAGNMPFFIFRLIIMPQDVADIIAHITGNSRRVLPSGGGGGYPTTTVIVSPLGEFDINFKNNPVLSSLKGGAYYRIRVYMVADKEDKWEVEIEDWSNGGNMTLNPQ